MSREFKERHIGAVGDDQEKILSEIGVSSFKELIDQCLPSDILLAKEPDLPPAVSEYEILQEMMDYAAMNQRFASYIGFGYYGTIIPPVIQRNILENPGWYTAYTPYQSEISQGRLASLLNFQTMISDLTKLPIANASLLDEATAGAEAMEMFFRKVADDRVGFFVSQRVFPQTRDLIKGRAKALNIECVIGDELTHDFSKDKGLFGVLLQNPDQNGEIHNYNALLKELADQKIYSAVASDLLYLVMHEADPAQVILGNSQRFGVPLGYGGPHAAFFATSEEFIRDLPGRIVGVSKDRLNHEAFRLSLQTREQHIRRERATSNICTAQALLAIMASMYAVYHGPQGLHEIAQRVHRLTKKLADALAEHGHSPLAKYYFDTIAIALTEEEKDHLRACALKKKINFNYFVPGQVIIALDETVHEKDIKKIIQVFQDASSASAMKKKTAVYDSKLASEKLRKSKILTHPVFNSHHSETGMLRYMHVLEKKDLALNEAMIPLGSCTMKLNPTVAMVPITWPQFCDVHPFAPRDQNQGYKKILEEFKDWLKKVTGFDGVALEPNSGAQGEYAGLLAIRAYFIDKGEDKRNIVLIPNSAHGTNPASATKAGFKVVIIKCTENGDIDVADLKQKISQYQETLSCLMLTYPSTHGVFEERVREICQLIHSAGGQVYMDGANMNAQVLLTNPAIIGADVCHINLHKTFSIPHGGGGPGMGPICVRKHLIPFLSRHILIRKEEDNERSVEAISAAPWGSALILLISYITMRILGKEGLREATCMAIANANYLKKKLSQEYSILYSGKNDFVAHEFILDCREFKQKCGIEVEDIAKRLIDYGFHAPTMSWPVAGTMMIEPTESEPKVELDRFYEAMMQIKKELLEISQGEQSREDNVLKNAPHPATEVCSDIWSHQYSREKAAFPLRGLCENKFWSPVARVDNAWGDRNIFCVCPPIDSE